jgi:hypothetical protein
MTRDQPANTQAGPYLRRPGSLCTISRPHDADTAPLIPLKPPMAVLPAARRAGGG